MRIQIKVALARLEAQHGIQILYACESGSRAWGFPSPDSDYDVRFLYVHPAAWYLTLDEGADTLKIFHAQPRDAKDVQPSVLQCYTENDWCVKVAFWCESKFTDRMISCSPPADGPLGR